MIGQAAPPTMPVRINITGFIPVLLLSCVVLLVGCGPAVNDFHLMRLRKAENDAADYVKRTKQADSDLAARIGELEAQVGRLRETAADAETRAAQCEGPAPVIRRGPGFRE